MVWLRFLLYLSPLVMGFGAAILFREVARLSWTPGSGALTTSIRENIGPLAPFLSVEGTTREVLDLIFEPILLRDENLELRPNFIASWEEETLITIRCEDEESAGLVEAKLRSGEYLDKGMVPVLIERFGSVVSVALEGFGQDFEERLLERIDPLEIGDYLLIELTLKHSVRDSLRTFLADAVEKAQVRMVEYEGDQVARLFARGETDLLLKELELYYAANRGLEPEIAVRGKRSHTSSRELTLHLSDEIRWHDGKRVTGEDLLFSLEELTRDGSPLPMNSSFRFVEEAALVDDFAVRVVCRETPATMMESWEKLPLLPAHLLRGNPDPERWQAFSQDPVGYGPYRVVRRRADGGVEMVRHEMYHGTLPAQERLLYRKFDSLESKLLALRSSRIDALVPDERFADWADRNPGRVFQARGRPRFQHFVAWNLAEAPFDDREVRMALAEAVDVKSILRDSPTEFQDLVGGLFRPGTPGSDKVMPLPLYDPKSAERRLERAGFRFDSEKGARVDSSGNLLMFPLVVNEANAEHFRFARELAAQWAAVGVTVGIVPMSWRDIRGTALASREFSAAILSWEIPTGRDRHDIWHSSAARPDGGNLFGLRDGRVDELLEGLRRVSKPATLAESVDGLQRRIAELQPCFFLGESGRVLWLREGAVEVVLPGGEEGQGTLSAKAAGEKLEALRPWWVRLEGDAADDAGNGESEKGAR